MPGDVKRPYDASRRREAARESRVRTMEVARRAFLSSGYASTTLAQIADEAGVSVQAVNKNFGSKAGLLRALFDVALVGDDDPAPLESRTWIRAIHEEPDPQRKLALYGRVLADMLPRTAPIQLLLREAARSDPAIADVWDQITTGRLAGMRNMATNLAEGGHLRAGVSVEDARDVLWVYSSPDLYQLLVMQRGWKPERYADFLASSTSAALL